MKRLLAVAVAVAALTTSVSTAGGERLGQLGGIVKRAQQFRELQVTEQEEQQIGAGVSQKLRERYGVVQDANVHRYVALVGGVIAQASSRPALPWTFIVLDTDAVNAFAAPGGFVHITRGALGLIQNEAELAGVLGHEVVHITEKHTIGAIQKNKTIQMGANETLSGNAALLNKVVDNVYLDIIEKGFGRSEENESDQKGVVIANTVGYAPQGLASFLTRLQERNKDATAKRGLFASHPEMKERLDRLAKQIQSAKLTSAATVEARYRKNISYKPVPQAEIAAAEAGSAGLTGGGEKPAAKADAKSEPKKEEPKKKGFGLSRMLPTGGGEQKSAQASASGGTRGVDPERDAKGGPNPKPVPVKIVAADLTAFKQEGGLK
jgi:beta-barrel assembly-enhancing protease